MIRRVLLLAVFAVLAAFAIGCGPPWAVVVQAVPDPFAGQRRFAVAPTDFSALRVGAKSEAEYLAEKDEKQRQSFASDKAAANEEFTRALLARAMDAGVQVVLATGPSDAPFIIRPSMTFFEPGFYVGVASGASRLDVNLKITTPDGQVLDEVLFTHQSAAPTMNAGILGALTQIDKMSSGGRIRADAEWIGKTAGKYLESRVAP
jgi:hypothetical protein